MRFPNSVAEAMARDSRFIGLHALHAFATLVDHMGAITTDAFWRVVTEFDHPLGNFAMLADDQNMTPLERVLEDFAGRSATLRTCVEPGPEVVQRLLQAGFERRAEIPNMALEIGRLANTSIPDKFLLRRLHGEDQSLFLEAACGIYAIPEFFAAWCAPKQDALEASDTDDIQWFGAFEGPDLIAFSAFYVVDGIAGIYCVGTRPDYRGQGIGGHLTAHAVRKAACLGPKVAVLQASPSGLPVYRRLGFEVVNTCHQYVRKLGE